MKQRSRNKLKHRFDELSTLFHAEGSYSVRNDIFYKSGETVPKIAAKMNIYKKR